MKTLKLKMKDLTNPTILTHHEIKNIMGGSLDGGQCTITIRNNDGSYAHLHPTFGGAVTMEGMYDYCSTECMNNSDLWGSSGYCYSYCEVN